MRISTSQIYDAGSLNIQRNQAALFKLQNQLSMNRPRFFWTRIWG